MRSKSFLKLILGSASFLAFGYFILFIFFRLDIGYIKEESFLRLIKGDKSIFIENFLIESNPRLEIKNGDDLTIITEIFRNGKKSYDVLPSISYSCRIRLSNKQDLAFSIGFVTDPIVGIATLSSRDFDGEQYTIVFRGELLEKIKNVISSSKNFSKTIPKIN